MKISLNGEDSKIVKQNETYTLIDPAPFSPTINQTNISCYGANDGVLEVINEPTLPAIMIEIIVGANSKIIVSLVAYPTK